jgi:hypothetical protein
MAINLRMAKIRFILATAIIGALLPTSGAHADDDAMEKYRDWLPSQILSMPEEQRRSEIPIAYVMSAKTEDLAIQSYLNTLMYSGLADFDGAKRRFQADLGEPQTGNLTVGQVTELAFRADRMQLTPVYFFSYKFGGRINQYSARVRGTVKILDENIAYPVNYVEINCEKEAGICNYRQFILDLPDKNSWSQSYRVTETFNDEFTITRWEKDRLDARPLLEGSCRIPELRLNFATNGFYEIVTNAPEGDCELLSGESLPKLEKPRISQIVDGDPLIRAVFQKIGEENYKFLSSEFRAKAEIVFKADPSAKTGEKAN